jgi:uncharacterized protein YndB with AHSA1/START domain
MKAEKTIVINRPIEEVFAFLADIDNISRWVSIENVKQTSSGPIGVGSTFSSTVHLAGQKLDANAEVTAYEPPHTFAFKASSGATQLESKFTLTPVNDTTQIAALAEGDPGPLGKLAGPFLNTLAKKQLESQLESLKKILEGQS